MLTHLSDAGSGKLEANLGRLELLYSQLSPTRPWTRPDPGPARGRSGADARDPPSTSGHEPVQIHRQ
jgi:hypothetical protein